MTVKVWADYACPFCYIGVKNLVDAMEKSGNHPEVKLMAFELDPSAPEEYTGPSHERIMKNYSISEEEALSRLEEVRQMGMNSDITINGKDSRYTNTFTAHRLTEYAYRKLENKDYLKFALDIYKGYHTDGKELSDRNFLLETALNHGLPEKETTDLLESEEYSNELRKDEQKASLNGITGVPYFIIGDFTIPGAVSSDKLISVLERYREVK